MFGDISAWMYQYLAGIVPDPENPGFKHFIIKPHPVNGLKWVRAAYTPSVGKIELAWKQSDGRFELEIEIPSATTATVIMPDSSRHDVASGKHRFSVLSTNE
jgi:hypothetical protein